MIIVPSSPLPLPSDQWSEEYVLFLLDTIESPPEEDEDDQVPDGILNVILSFNQHFQGETFTLAHKLTRDVRSGIKQSVPSICLNHTKVHSPFS